MSADANKSAVADPLAADAFLPIFQGVWFENAKKT